MILVEAAILIIWLFFKFKYFKFLMGKVKFILSISLLDKSNSKRSGIF